MTIYRIGEILDFTAKLMNLKENVSILLRMQKHKLILRKTLVSLPLSSSLYY